MGIQSLSADKRPHSVLDRKSFQTNSPLTEAQALTDQLVSVSLQEATNLKTAAALFGAGWVGRATRIGALSTLPGQAFARSLSYVPGLAAESAAFAGIERRFHPSSQPFQRDWAKAAVTLTGLKVFGGLSRAQNIVVQHLFTDLGLVGSQHAASAIGLADSLQGNLAQQMLLAETTNWQLKGSLAFAHSLSPRLLSAERSLDIFLKTRETSSPASPFDLQPYLEVEGAFGAYRVGIAPETLRESSVFRMSDAEGNGGLRKGSGSSGDRSAQPGSFKRRFILLSYLLFDKRPLREALEDLLLNHVESVTRMTAAESLGVEGNPSSRPALEQALNDSSQEVREAAQWALSRLGTSAGEQSGLRQEPDRSTTDSADVDSIKERFALDPANMGSETKPKEDGSPPRRSLGRKLLDLVTEDPPTLPVSSIEFDYLTTLPPSYRPSRGPVIEKIFAHLETLRAGLERGTLGRRKFIEEYERAVELLPKKDPTVRDKIEREFEKVRSYFKSGCGLNGKAHLEIYGILIASLPEGDSLLHTEADLLRELFYKLDFFKGLINLNAYDDHKAKFFEAYAMLIERYSLGDPKAGEDAAWLKVLVKDFLRDRLYFSGERDLYSKPYLRALEKLPMNHPEGVKAYREAWQTPFRFHAKDGYILKPYHRVQLDMSDRIMKALETRLSKRVLLEIKAEPLEDPFP